MRRVLVSLLFIGAATALNAMNLACPEQQAAHHFTVLPETEYRFAGKFCRAQYNNPIDRNACMMRATGTPLATAPESEDDR
jgi:hypothetical protein